MASVTLRSIAIMMTLFGLVGTMSPALEKIGLVVLLAGIVLLIANTVARRRVRP